MTLIGFKQHKKYYHMACAINWSSIAILFDGFYTQKEHFNLQLMTKWFYKGF